MRNPIDLEGETGPVGTSTITPLARRSVSFFGQSALQGEIRVLGATST
jgi:hypothetical protein